MFGCSFFQDLAVTDNPVSCETCMGYLHSQFNFIMRCLEADETINGYITSQGLAGGDKLNLHDVVQYSFRNCQMDQSADYENSLTELEEKNFIPFNDSFGVCGEDGHDTMMDALLGDMTTLSQGEIDVNCENN